MFRPKSAFILLLPGFDESWVIQLIDRLQARGCLFETISLKPRGLRGMHGLMVLPDRKMPTSLGQVYLFIPECAASLSTLMTEPRVHALIGSVLADEGSVIVPPSVAAAFTRVGLTTTVNRNYHVITSVERVSELIAQM